MHKKDSILLLLLRFLFTTFHHHNNNYCGVALIEIPSTLLFFFIFLFALTISSLVYVELNFALFNFFFLLRHCSTSLFIILKM